MKILYVARAGDYIWHFVDEDYKAKKEYQDQLYEDFINRTIAERVETVNVSARILALTPEQYEDRITKAKDKSIFKNLEIHPVKFAGNYKVEVHEIRQEELG